MARKYDLISELYDRTCKTVVSSPQNWEAFLTSACRNYKLRFDEQLLVFAQRPDATAVLEIERWNGTFGRWVNRGATGIAVFDDASRSRQRLIHYFDISDTHPSKYSRPVPIWKMKPEYEQEITETLESTFGTLDNSQSLADTVMSAAQNAAEDNLPDYTRDLLYSVNDSFLEELDEDNISTIYRKVVTNSVAYMMMERLGIDTEEYFEREDFEDIINFNTPGTLNALGFATSDIAEMGLTEIAKTVMSLERQNRIIAENRKPDYNIGRNQNTERSPQNERADIHDAGRLQTAQFGAAGTAGSADGTVLPNEGEVPEREPQGAVLQSPDELQAERASDADRTDGDRNGGTPDERDGGEGRIDREPESDGYDELGSEDEQPEEPSSGNRDEGSNLRLEYYDRSNEDRTLPFFGHDDTIREILATTPHLKATKDEIRAFYESVADEDKRTEYIKSIFNNDFTEVILGDGRRVGYKTYQNVLQLWEGSYLSRTKQSFYDWGVIAKHFEAMRLLGELQDTMKPLPSMDGQMSLMLNYEAEVTKPSAFSFSQEIIDAVLTRGSGVSEGKFRIYEQFQKSLSKKENVDFLKNEYGWGGSYPVITGTGIDEQHDGKGIKISKNANGEEVKVLLNWNQVEKRISELIKMDRYLNPKEKELYPAWLEQHEIRRAEAAEERRKREILSTAPSEKKEPESSNERYEYHLGNTVYLGANEYEILSFDKDRVMLYDTQFPLFNKEMTRAEFDQKVQENPMNDHLKVKVLPAEEITDNTKVRISLDSGNDLVHWIYFNPDANAGGQYVSGDLSFTVFEELIEQYDIANHPENTDRFVADLEEMSDQFLADINTPFFMEAENDYEMDCDYTEFTPENILKIHKDIQQFEAEHQAELNRMAGQNEPNALPVYDRETEILYDVLSALKIDDVVLEYDSAGLVAKDSMDNEWHGQEFYKFLVEEAFVFEDDGGVLGIRDKLLKDFTELSEHNGVPVKDNRVREPYRSYLAVKAENPDSLVLYQVGDFYEAYGEDAQKVAEALDLVMTSRAISDSERVPMVGFPQHTLETYMNMLTDRGFDLTVSTVDGSERKVLSIVSQNKEAPVESKPIGRIDYLHTDGRVRESIEYTSPYQFEKDIKEENYYGVPMKIVLYKDRDGTTIQQDFISQLDPPPQGVEIIDSPYLKSSLDIAKEIIDEYCREEFERDEGADYSNLSEVNVAYTTTEDDKHEIQANVNLVDFKIETLVDGTVIRTEQYDSLEDMTERGLKNLSFDDLVYLSEEEIERVEKASAPVVPAWEQPKKSKVQSFDLHPEIPMSERHNFDLANNEITEVNKKERFHRNYAAITVLKRCQQENRFATPDEQKILSRYVGWGGIPEAFDERAGAWHTEYAMCQLSGKTEAEIYEDLKGVIFLNPMYGYGNSTEAKYLMADEYLSGNVREKLAWAKKSAQLSPEEYSINVEALQKVQPKDLTASEISVRLGATWLPPEIVEQFVFEFLGTPRYAQWNIKIHFSEYTGEWNIEGKSYDRGNVKAYSTYGTSRINAYKIIEETLNLKDVRIFDYEEDADGKKKAILNKKETAIAQAKQELIKQGFQDWIWSDPERRERLCKLYNEKFNSIRPREYDGSHITFNGMNPEIELREHQRNAVAHILYGGNTLLAHAVGAGKTFEMTAAAMESKRLGLCSKSLFVVPNHLTEQWASEFLQLYPSANILVATKKDFETKNRKRFCGRIATGDYDAIIIGHSQFEKIPMSIERQRAILEQQLEEVTNGIADLKRNRGDNFSVKQLERTKKSVKQKLDKLNDQSKKDDVVTFEELGVDRLFIDESHYYKNLFLYTKMRNVGGIAQTEAQKSSDLFMKCRYLDEITGGRGTVFATGTPISNSMVELYTIQRYLQYNTLVENNLQHFDAWASTFGETVTAVELTPEGTGYRAKTRFARFYNLPELMAMFKEVADIKTADMLDLPVPKAVYHNISVKPSEIQKQMVAELAERAEKVRNGMVDASVDNMLKITNDGRKLALDQRLINPMLPDFEGSKLNACVDAMFETWEKGKEKRLTQLFFCDLSTPKNDGNFSVYDDIRKKLIERGVPAEEIKFIHEADTETKKLELFKKVRKGDVRILMGSTQKMGAGTNVQNKLAASSDLDCPWRPSDLEQRLGRSIRQGNENLEVDIYRFVTEETFDAYLYQLVEGKQKFASQIMTSKSPVRSCEDIDETALSYAEIKMLATGNPYIKEKMDLDIQVQKLRLLKSNFLSERYALEDKIIKFYPQEIARRTDTIAGLKSDIERAKQHPKPLDDSFIGMTVKGVFYSEKADAGNAILDACQAMTSPNPVPLGEYRGFQTELSFDTFAKEYKVKLKGELGYSVSLGTDTFGNITRLDNALEGLPKRLEINEQELENVKTQFETAKVDVEKPFNQEEELKTKTARLNELNALLNVDKRENEIVGGEPDEGDEEPTPKSKDRER